MNIYFRIVYMFFATGLFSIGGGLATLPFLYDMSTRTNWFTHHDIANMLAVSQSVPGAVGINISTFAGFHTAGIPGALLAALSLITPGLNFIYCQILGRFPRKPYRKLRLLRTESGIAWTYSICSGRHRNSDIHKYGFEKYRLDVNRINV